LRVGEFMRRTLAGLLARGDVPDRGFPMASITITEVRVSADLREASVYFIPLGGRGEEAACEALERNRGQLQRATARKFAPRLRFIPDRSFDRIDRIDRLLAEDPSEVAAE